jgi:hypothetical protein
MARTATLRIDTDHSRLGDAATKEDLQVYAANLARKVGEELGVEILVVNGQFGTRTTSDDADVQARVREIEAGDEWIDLLPHEVQCDSRGYSVGD